MQTDALILAGGTLKGFESEKALTKALIKINGKSMVEYVVDALKGSTRIGRIVVVIPAQAKDFFLSGKVDKVLIGGSSVIENVQQGFEYLNSSNPVLVITSDIPLLTSRAIDDFLISCEKKDAEIYYPIVSKNTIHSVLPKAERTYISLKEGIFTGGNLGLVAPRVVEENAELMKTVFSLRKSPLKLFRILSFTFVLKFIFHLLTLGELEQKCSELLGAKAAVVISSFPEIGIDVDKPSDLKLVMDVLKGLSSEKRVTIITEEAPLPVGPYSQAIRAKGMVFVSGQIPIIPESGEIFKGSIKNQAELIFNNIEKILIASDSSLSNIVKISVFMRNLDDFGELNSVFKEVFKISPPARETVQVSRLPLDVDIEISVVALSNH
ncbi:MAG: NTP transferase domain-containing protein [Actinobacteria bacterium]|nr:NTP transferase domain-containing protein [Actinomycetota bacterium]